MRLSREIAILIGPLTAALSIVPLGAQAQPEGLPFDEAAATITESDLRARIGTLAHDSMRGRSTPSPELEKAARYIASKFRTFGLLPAVGDDYLQRYPVTTMRLGPTAAQSLELHGPRGERIELSPATDFIAVPAGERLEGEGPVVVADADDRETDLLGRVALVQVTSGTLRTALGTMRELLEGRKAAAVILVIDAQESYLDGIRRFFGSERTALGDAIGFPGPVALVPASKLPQALSDAIRSGGPTEGWSAVLRSQAEIIREEAMNTVGWLEGSDPELKNEYVIFTAHMDHVGVGRPVNGDSIYNGADDDASGTAAVVELAQAFARTRPRPKRSLIFVTVSGEEKGLWGSRWYVENPPFPLENTVANINLDMIGRNWQDTIAVIGLEQSTLGETARRIAGGHPELDMTVVDDQWPGERFYYRSDHYNFARNGVPILFFFSGTHEDYHRPSDEPSRIEYEKTARVTRLLYYLGLEVANAEDRPRWDPEAYRSVVGGEGGQGG
jgi:hypothetical protein